MIAPASTTMPAMISNTSNCGSATTATRPVEFTMALCMAWNNPAINTLEPAPLYSQPVINRIPKYGSRKMTSTSAVVAHDRVST